jgi:hypothetical protein
MQIPVSFYQSVIPIPVGSQVPCFIWNIGVNGLYAPFTTFTASIGSWVVLADNNQTTGGYVHNTTNALNDKITLPSVYLTPGTWKCTIMALTNNVRGISTLQLNGTNYGTADWYSAILTYSVQQDITGIVISTEDWYSVAFQMLSKNPLSSTYWFDPTWVRFERTS